MKHAADVDERTIAAEQSAGALAYVATSYLLVLDMLVRGVAPSWVDLKGFPLDIPVILFAGGLVRLWETRRRDALPPSRVKLMLLAIGVGFVAAALAVLVKRAL